MKDLERALPTDADAEVLAGHHRRYLDLVGRFKSAWTFHQFLEGLQKIFVDADLGDYHPGEFRDLYQNLKELSDRLDSSSREEFESKLASVEAIQSTLLATLAEQDSRLSPSLHRALFHRIDTYDHQILARLLRFYIYCWKTDLWTGDDACDKADLLMTRLAEDTTPGEAEPDWPRVQALFEGVVVGLVEAGAVDGGLVETLCGLIEESRLAGAEADSIEDIRAIVSSYRQLKHELGPHFFLPDIMMAVVRTNWALRLAVQRIFQREERGIFAETERIFELEGRVEIDTDLDQRLTEMRSAITSFEQRVQNRDVRLDEVSTLRRSIEDLIPRLGAGKEGRPRPLPPERPSASGPAHRAAMRPAPASEELLDKEPAPETENELLREDYRDLVRALEAEVPGTSDLVEVCRAPRLAPFGLEPREVLAYRRVVEGRARDPRFERLVLVAAALRRAIRREAEDLRSTQATGVVESGNARLATRLASEYEGRLRQAVDEATLGGEVNEAQALQVLRMRLLRDAAELWLLVHRSLGIVAVDRLEQSGQ